MFGKYKISSGCCLKIEHFEDEILFLCASEGFGGVCWYFGVMDFNSFATSCPIDTSCVQSAEDEAIINKVRSKKVMKKYEARKKLAKVETALDEQFSAGRVLGEFSPLAGRARHMVLA